MCYRYLACRSSLLLHLCSKSQSSTSCRLNEVTDVKSLVPPLTSGKHAVRVAVFIIIVRWSLVAGSLPPQKLALAFLGLLQKSAASRQAVPGVIKSSAQTVLFWL